MAAALLEGRRIIVTRSEADNRSLVTALSARGADVIQIPLIEVHPPLDDGRALADAVAKIEVYRWVVLTSVNGVDALGRALGSRPWPPSTEVMPVGPATAEAALAMGMRTAPPPPAAHAAAMVEHFPPLGPDGRDATRVLAPLAELAGSTVVDGLTAKGYRVDRVTAYRTEAPADSVAAESRSSAPDADAVAFFSPSAVDRFVERFPETPTKAETGPNAVFVICIGPSTAARAVQRGLLDPIVAELHTEAGVIDALTQALTAPA